MEKDLNVEKGDKEPSPVSSGYTIVLDDNVSAADHTVNADYVYQDTVLPLIPAAGREDQTGPDGQAGQPGRPEGEALPERLRQMRRLYEYGRESYESKAKNFYRQAAFMADYEDDAPWIGHFTCYFPTYHDLSTRQLRGYFSWRTRVRKGDYQPIETSAAYIYIYELLNGIGADGPEDVLDKLKAFETGFIDTAGAGDAAMRANLRRWMLEYAILQNLPPEVTRTVADHDLIERDEALAALKAPDQYLDEEVFKSLHFFAGKRLENTPVLSAAPDRGESLFSQAWRKAVSDPEQKKDLFTRIFGEKVSRFWHPLSNAVYYRQSRQADCSYVLDECRSYHCKSGIWHVEGFEKLSFNRGLFQSFIHETDAMLRRYLKTGRYLQEKTADAWARPYIEAVIGEDRQAMIEAARPKITIDLSGLDRIRRDAMTTRDSLLTAEELGEETFEMTQTAAPEPAQGISGEEAATKTPAEKAAVIQPAAGETKPESIQIQILRILLSGSDPAEIIRSNHLMPSIIADSINEALYDEIGDNVIFCEDDQLSLVEDYIEDIEDYLGGIDHGQA